MSTPITVVKAGSIEFAQGGITVRNWVFNMGNRTGPVEMHNVEVFIAVRDHMNARFNAAIMMQSDDQFSDVGEMRVLTTKALEALGMLKKPWWKRIFGA